MKKDMMDSIIRKFGFESIYSQTFCELVETGVDMKLLLNVYDAYMSLNRIENT